MVDATAAHVGMTRRCTHAGHAREGMRPTPTSPASPHHAPQVETMATDLLTKGQQAAGKQHTHGLAPQISTHAAGGTRDGAWQIDFMVAPGSVDATEQADILLGMAALVLQGHANTTVWTGEGRSATVTSMVPPRLADPIAAACTDAAIKAARTDQRTAAVVIKVTRDAGRPPQQEPTAEGLRRIATATARAMLHHGAAVTQPPVQAHTGTVDMATDAAATEAAPAAAIDLPLGATAAEAAEPAALATDLVNVIGIRARQGAPKLMSINKPINTEMILSDMATKHAIDLTETIEVSIADSEGAPMLEYQIWPAPPTERTPHTHAMVISAMGSVVQNPSTLKAVLSTMQTTADEFFKGYLNDKHPILAAKYKPIEIRLIPVRGDAAASRVADIPPEALLTYVGSPFSGNTMAATGASHGGRETATNEIVLNCADAASMAAVTAALTVDAFLVVSGKPGKLYSPGDTTTTRPTYVYSYPHPGSQFIKGPPLAGKWTTDVSKYAEAKQKYMIGAGAMQPRTDRISNAKAQRTIRTLVLTAAGMTAVGDTPVSADEVVSARLALEGRAKGDNCQAACEGLVRIAAGAHAQAEARERAVKAALDIYGEDSDEEDPTAADTADVGPTGTLQALMGALDRATTEAQRQPAQGRQPDPAPRGDGRGIPPPAQAPGDREGRPHQHARHGQPSRAPRQRRSHSRDAHRPTASQGATSHAQPPPLRGPGHQPAAPAPAQRAAQQGLNAARGRDITPTTSTARALAPAMAVSIAAHNSTPPRNTCTPTESHTRCPRQTAGTDPYSPHGPRAHLPAHASGAPGCRQSPSTAEAARAATPSSRPQPRHPAQEGSSRRPNRAPALRKEATLPLSWTKPRADDSPADGGCASTRACSWTLSRMVPESAQCLDPSLAHVVLNWQPHHAPTATSVGCVAYELVWPGH